MPELTIAAAAAPFSRDMDACLATIEQTIADARRHGVGLLVLPEAALGGYVETLHGDAEPPPALSADGPELAAVAAMAGDMVVCVGFCEDGGDGVRYNAAACLTGDGVIGVHRKTHLPLDEDRISTVGDSLATYDTPVGRIGMLICYDKAFPEAARTLTLDGAEVLCFLSAWPTSATNPAPVLTEDRQWRRAELWDRARAAENSLVVASANQTGSFGRLDFLGGARITGPGGDILAATGPEPGLAITTLDLETTLTRARRALSPIRDLRPDLYRVPEPVPYPDAAPVRG
ncbi:MAG TPA: carbon-nitrogen hydrolase family protein [Solirubrobacteraceae bacterium]|nr:carbon-nitrogen hydrolase family protein [Solirubrobacteraceae bacterium]